MVTDRNGRAGGGCEGISVVLVPAMRKLPVRSNALNTLVIALAVAAIFYAIWGRP